MKLNRIIIFAMLISIVAGITCGCNSDSKDDDRTKFTVGFDAEFPPYGFKEGNEYVGYDLELAKEVCDRNNWELVKQPLDWDSKDMELNSGSIDCIWNGFTINGRENLYTWSKAYVNNSQVVIVKADSGIEKLEDLKGKVVIVQTDSSALAAFTGEDATKENIALCESFKELSQVSDYNSAFLNLESGAADAVCLDYGVAKFQLEQRGSVFKMLDENVSTELYGIGFKKGNVELRDQIQDTLDEMLEDGTFQKISEKWELTDSICLGMDGTFDAYNADKKEVKKQTFKEKMMYIAKQLGKGMLATLTIFVLTLVISMPLGLLICKLRMSRFSLFSLLAKIYISILRGTPLMLQLLVVFFGPYYVLGVAVNSAYRFYAVIIGFSLNYAAYFAEIYRSGIETIPNGQYEAAHVLDYSKTQTFWKIIFPQMVRRVIPPVTNEVITLVKDTSLAFALAYTEMFTIAKQVAASQASILPLFVAGLFYYIFNVIIAYIMGKVEKNYEYFK